MQLQKNAIDLGIVTGNGDAMLNFYRDVLGLAEAGAVELPLGSLRKLQCGDSVIKLLALARPAVAAAPGGGYAGATGLRYCTITLADLDATVARCRDAGCRIAVEIVSPRPGLRAAIVEDPDGNAVELMELS